MGQTVYYGNFTSKAVLQLDRTVWDVHYGSGSFFENLGNNVIDDMFTITFTIIAK